MQLLTTTQSISSHVFILSYYAWLLIHQYKIVWSHFFRKKLIEFSGHRLQWTSLDAKQYGSTCVLHNLMINLKWSRLWEGHCHHYKSLKCMIFWLWARRSWIKKTNLCYFIVLRLLANNYGMTVLVNPVHSHRITCVMRIIIK